MTYRVEFSDASRRQVRAIQRWWRANRPAAPELFKQELRSAVARLVELPLAVPAPDVGRPGVRRLILSRTRYHLYLVGDQAGRHVRILAVWHTSRGSLPPLDE